MLPVTNFCGGEQTERRYFVFVSLVERQSLAFGEVHSSTHIQVEIDLLQHNEAAH